jgi:hypothetical protein
VRKYNDAISTVIRPIVEAPQPRRFFVDHIHDGEAAEVLLGLDERSVGEQRRAARVGYFLRMKLRRPIRLGIPGLILMLVSLAIGWSDRGSWVGWVSVVGFLVGAALLVADSLATSSRRRS